MNHDESVAVVSMHVRLPNATGTCEGLWDLLLDGRDVFTRGPVTSRHVSITSHIEDASWFAAEHFGISDFEADLMDPQHRVLLEMAWECLESTRSDKEKITGVFSSCSPSSLFEEVVRNHPELWERHYNQVIEGTQADFLATRIAYRLGLTGPAVQIGTGCSSSLVALNQAVQALNAFQCDRALVATASLRSPRDTGYVVRQGGINSPDGVCRPFSEHANGTVPGNGVAVVMLKRLEDAVADGDHVRAVIVGSAVNNDGARKAGFAAPSVEGQIDCVASALDVAEVDAAQVRYIEAHGTGTNVGDPIELRALAKAYGTTAPGRDRFLGSLKANIGHCDVAAGLLGLIKTVMVLEKGTVPAQLYARTPTTKHDWSDGAFRLPLESVDLTAGSDNAPLVAAVSSLGVGGTNAHVLLRDARDLPRGERGRVTTSYTRLSGRRPYGIGRSAEAEASVPDPVDASVRAPASARVTATLNEQTLFTMFSQHTTDPVTGADDDFFELGGDSIGLIYLLDELSENHGFDASIEEFTETPTVSFVRERLRETAGRETAAAVVAGTEPSHVKGPLESAADDDLTTVVADVTARLARIGPTTGAVASAGDKGVVLLTGATGFVGAFVLAELLSRGEPVVCLLRGGAERRPALVEKIQDLGLWRERHDSYLRVVAGDVALPRLGLSREDHDELNGSVGRIVHCAAWVNHIYPYERLADVNAHSAGELLEFAATGRRKSLVSVSTSAVLDSAGYPEGTEVDAAPLTALPPIGDGYGRSKAIAELYLAQAGELGVPAAVVRIPNVFGDREHFQINGSDALWSWTRAITLTGRHPSSFELPGNELFQALPADVAARVIVDAAGPGDTAGCRFVNAVPNLVCGSRSLLAGLRASGHDSLPVPDREWYGLVAALDPREVWVAGIAARSGARPDSHATRRLHRFLPDEHAEVSREVNAHAIWTPQDLTGYLESLTGTGAPAREGGDR